MKSGKLSTNLKWWILAAVVRVFLILYMVLFLIFAVVLFIIYLPMMIPVEIAMFFIRRRVICKTICSQCGVKLGRESIAESKRVSAKIDEFRRESPKAKYTLVQHDAICMDCGQKYEYHSQGKCYLPVKEPKPSSIED